MVTTVLAGVVREPQTMNRRGSKPLDTRREDFAQTIVHETDAVAARAAQSVF